MLTVTGGYTVIENGSVVMCFFCFIFSILHYDHDVSSDCLQILGLRFGP